MNIWDKNDKFEEIYFSLINFASPSKIVAFLHGLFECIEISITPRKYLTFFMNIKKRYLQQGCQIVNTMLKYMFIY